MRSCLSLFGTILIVAVFIADAAGGAPEPLTTVRVASGLSSPLYVTHAPDDPTRVFIVQQGGTIRILDITQDPPALVGSPFLDISGIVRTGGERGLLGMAFHPDYANNGFFYVNYTGFSGPAGDTFISRFHVPAGTPNVADPGSELVLLMIPQPQSNHNGGWIAFGPNDGYLYIGTGDGGNAGDTGTGHTNDGGNAQDITDNLLGKMLRIDVDGDDFPSDPQRNYAIPADNPFVGVTGDDEIWAYGLRNPWRNAFDSQTGNLYMADVGQNLYEEVSFQPGTSGGGENYGWRCFEGFNTFDTASTPCQAPPESFVEPIHEYDHGAPNFSCSITGGEVYHGCAIPSLDGTYFFADWCSNRIWSFRYEGDPPQVVDFADRTSELDPPGGQSITEIVSFGLDAEGEMYICEQNGEVYKILPVGDPVECSECGDSIREGIEDCDGTDDAACPGECQLDCQCPYVPPVPGAGDDTCHDGLTDTGTPCTKTADCPLGEVCGGKSRYISVTPPSSSVAGTIARAIQVTVTDMPLDPARVGEVWWADAPQGLPNPPNTALTGARLLCTGTPHFETWAGDTLVHLYGEVVVPGATFDVRMCDDLSTCSPPVAVSTGDWGDVIIPFGGEAQPNFSDISSVVDKFRNLATAPDMPRTDLAGPGNPGDQNVPNQQVNFADISGNVDAFRDVAFPFSVAACP